VIVTRRSRVVAGVASCRGGVAGGCGSAARLVCGQALRRCVRVVGLVASAWCVDGRCRPRDGLFVVRWVSRGRMCVWPRLVLDPCFGPVGIVRGRGLAPGLSVCLVVSSYRRCLNRGVRRLAPWVVAARFGLGVGRAVLRYRVLPRCWRVIGFLRLVYRPRFPIFESGSRRLGRPCPSCFRCHVVCCCKRVLMMWWVTFPLWLDGCC